MGFIISYRNRLGLPIRFFIGGEDSRILGSGKRKKKSGAKYIYIYGGNNEEYGKKTQVFAQWMSFFFFFGVNS